MAKYYTYEVEFKTDDEPFDVKINVYRARTSKEARQMFMKDVREMGGSKDDVDILSAKRIEI